MRSHTLIFLPVFLSTKIEQRVEVDEEKESVHKHVSGNTIRSSLYKRCFSYCEGAKNFNTSEQTFYY